VALAWLLHNPAVTAPIVGATKPHHIDDAVAALDIQLTDAELDALEEAYRPQQVQHDRNERLQPGQTAAADLKHMLRRPAGTRGRDLQKAVS
jgi:diketogulonate reductase-like aldo/keto reductase